MTTVVELGLEPEGVQRFRSADLEKKEKGNTRDDGSLQFMLKEYDRIHSLWMDENRQAEWRVKFFLTVTSAAIACTALLLQSHLFTVDKKFFLAFAILSALLLFGLMMINRMNSRDANQRAFRKSFAEINTYFVERDPQIAEYIERQKDIYRLKFRTRLPRFLLMTFSGYLTYVVILWNGFIVAGIVTAILLYADLRLLFVILGAVAALVISWLAMSVYVVYMSGKVPPSRYYSYDDEATGRE